MGCLQEKGNAASTNGEINTMCEELLVWQKHGRMSAILYWPMVIIINTTREDTSVAEIGQDSLVIVCNVVLTNGDNY